MTATKLHCILHDSVDTYTYKHQESLRGHCNKGSYHVLTFNWPSNQASKVEGRRPSTSVSLSSSSRSWLLSLTSGSSWYGLSTIIFFFGIAWFYTRWWAWGFWVVGFITGFFWITKTLKVFLRHLRCILVWFVWFPRRGTPCDIMHKLTYKYIRYQAPVRYWSTLAQFWMKKNILIFLQNISKHFRHVYKTIN